MSTLRTTTTICLLTLLSCEQGSGKIDEAKFKTLMDRLAEAWTTQNTDMAVACFAIDAIYMQPPDEQLYVGHEQLRPFFGALEKGTIMRIHNTWFDEDAQTGAAEFTFGSSDSSTAVTGVTVVTIENGKIKAWREYFIEGPVDFKEFISPDNKNWKWTIKNYP